MFTFTGTRLRLCAQSTRLPALRSPLGRTRLIILQHILSDTAEFIRLLEDAGAEIFAIIAKPYSIDEDVLERLRSRYRVIQEDYPALEQTGVLDTLLHRAEAASAVDHKAILLLDVGGYFARPLSRLRTAHPPYIRGVVEITTFGHNRYRSLLDQIAVPVFSVARSPVKAIEARFVGSAAVTALDRVLRDIGLSLPGKQALVLGFGMIGNNVAEALRAQNMVVSAYDTAGLARLDAFTRGFHVENREVLLANADLICAATADRALTVEDMRLCKDNAILASVGSKGTEFDIAGLQQLAVQRTELSADLVQYLLPSGKHLVVMREGTAVNFIIRSCPDEVVDLVFAEALVGMRLLLDDRPYPSGKVHETPAEELHTLASAWLALMQ